MLVSRTDVVIDKIVDFPLESRFLKLPVENFLKVEGVTPIAPQYAVINAINSPDYRFLVCCLARRTGKTFIANTLGFLKAMEPDSKILIVSPNFSLTNISWNLQVDELKRHGIEIRSKNQTNREIHLENGSMIKFGSGNNPDSLVGHSYDLIIVDEAALERKMGDVFKVQLRPTLDKPNSKCIFISTPRGLNYFHDFYQRGFDVSRKNWVSIHSTCFDNPRANPEDIQEAKETMSSAEFRQEYLADFSVYEGQIYEDFDFDTQVADLSGMDFSGMDTIMGIDPGYKDHTGALVLKTDGEKWYAVWDYQVNKKTTSQHAREFRKAYDKYNVDMIFCDSAAAQFRADLISEHDLPSGKAKKSRLDGIAYCQSIVSDLIVDESCKDLLMMLSNYRWDPKEDLISPKPLHDKYSHLADAFRYALYTYGGRS
jgi:hypothetical protein